MPAVSAANTHFLFLHSRADLPPLPEKSLPEESELARAAVRRQQADCPNRTVPRPPNNHFRTWSVTAGSRLSSIRSAVDRASEPRVARITNVKDRELIHKVQRPTEAE